MNKIRKLLSGGYYIHPINPSLWRMLDNELVELERLAEIGRAVEWVTEKYDGCTIFHSGMVYVVNTVNGRYFKLLEAYRQSQKGE